MLRLKIISRGGQGGSFLMNQHFHTVTGGDLLCLRPADLKPCQIRVVPAVIGSGSTVPGFGRQLLAVPAVENEPLLLLGQNVSMPKVCGLNLNDLSADRQSQVGNAASGREVIQCYGIAFNPEACRCHTVEGGKKPEALCLDFQKAGGLHGSAKQAWPGNPICDPGEVPLGAGIELNILRFP